MIRGKRAPKRLKTRMYKLHNRRIVATLLSDGSIGYEMRSLQEDRSIYYHNIKMSVEGVAAMYDLANEITKGVTDD